MFLYSLIVHLETGTDRNIHKSFKYNILSKSPPEIQTQTKNQDS